MTIACGWNHASMTADNSGAFPINFTNDPLPKL